MVDSELESFKTNIDLRAYAAGQGYQIDAKASWRGTSVMRHSVNGDKIIVKRGLDGHYVYFSVKDDRDNGSIIDFVQFRLRISIGAVRKELRPWIGQSPVSVPSFAPLPKTEKDRMKVEAAYARTKDAIDGHPYLEKERALPASLFAHERFAERVRMDERGNAVFPHFDAQGLSGFELKNVGFTGFASGGIKALWLSHEFSGDNRLVFCESSIDALSHAALMPDNRTRYASVGGKLNPEQAALIRAAIRRMPKYAMVVAATDADIEGGKLADCICEAVQLSERDDLVFVRQEPQTAKDWNDVLRAKPHPLLPYSTEVPSVA